jgi:Flp pilus assembly protein TadD
MASNIAPTRAMSTPALHYAQALRATGQRAQAVAVLERVSLANPRDKTVLGAYGRALAEAGNFNQALEVLGRAHSPDQPDWHVLSAQGAVLDQMGRHAEAQRYYVTALKIVPEEPSVLSNLGLSYALAKDLPNAETTLRRAAARMTVIRILSQILCFVLGF